MRIQVKPGKDKFTAMVDGEKLLVGRSLIAQIVSLGAGIAVGIAMYSAGVLLLRVPEAGQIQRLVKGRLRRTA